MKSPTLPRQAPMPTAPWAGPKAVATPFGVASLDITPHDLSLTAAAARLAPRPVGRPSRTVRNEIGPNGMQAASWVSRSISWQNEVFAAYGQVGELHYAVNQIGRAAGRCFVVPNDSRSDVGPESPTSSATSPQRPDNSLKASQISRAVTLLKLVGEYYMVSRRNDPDPKNVDILSPVEVLWQRNGTAQLPIRWGVYDPRSTSDLRLTRVHQPDAAIYILADSAPRALLPVLRELIGLTMHVSSCIDSRLTSAGVLVYPASATAAAPSAGDDGPHDADMPLGDALLEAASHAIENRDTAAAHVPVLLELPDESITADSVKLIKFDVPLDAQASTLRDECVRRLAIGLDVPPEILLGMQNTTSHFATWAVNDEFVRLHIEPALEDVVDGFDVHFDDQYFTYDVSPLKRMPNLGGEAIQLYDRGELSGDSLRYANGFADQDAPKNITGKDAFEIEAWDKLESLLAKSPSLAQTPGLPAVLSQIKAAMRDETPENAIYPDAPIVVSEDEVPRGPGARDETEQEIPGAPIPNRDDPRQAPPAPKPTTREPRSDGSPNVGSKGRRPNLPADR